MPFSRATTKGRHYCGRVSRDWCFPESYRKGKSDLLPPQASLARISTFACIICVSGGYFQEWGQKSDCNISDCLVQMYALMVTLRAKT